jgi:hypothetical protein
MRKVIHKATLCEITVNGTKYKCKKQQNIEFLRGYDSFMDIENNAIVHTYYDLEKALDKRVNAMYFVVKEIINEKPKFTTCYSSADRKRVIEY